jgi:hypothetical protein
MGFVRDCFEVESLGEGRVPASVHNVEHRFARRTVGTENVLGQRARAREEVVRIYNPRKLPERESSLARLMPTSLGNR